MKRKLFSLAVVLVLLLGCMVIQAGALNPYLPLEHYVPDGEPRVFTYNGETRAYIYGSYDMDGFSYCSDIYHVFSAPVDDLNNWVDHGIAFASTGNWTSQGVSDGVSWSNAQLYAPDCIQGADGRFYLYFCTSDGAEGVAVSDTPYGPFTDAKRITFDGSDPGKMAAGTNASRIDPAVFIDDDGKIYYYWGQFNLQAAELNADMCTIKTSTYNSALITGPSSSPYTPIAGSFNFHEGSSMRKIGDTYYLIYCAVTSGGANTLDYATSDSPLGPFTYGGSICNNRALDPQSWNCHGSIAQINGEYYVFFHSSTENGNNDRRARVEKITINADGSIDQVENTSLGFQDYLDPYAEMLAPYACDRSGSCYFGDTTVDGQRAFPLVSVNDGSYVGYKYYEFGETPVVTMFNARVLARSGGTLEVRTGSANGRLLGSVAIPAGDGSTWQTVSSILTPVSGRQAIYLVFRGESGQVADLLSFSFADLTGKSVVSVSGSAAAENGAGVYEKGQTVTVDAGARLGYRFAGWTVEGDAELTDTSAARTTFVMPDGTVTLTANWEAYRVRMIYLDGEPLPGFDPAGTEFLVDNFAEIPTVTADHEEDGTQLVIEQANADNSYQAQVMLINATDAKTVTTRLEAESASFAGGSGYTANCKTVSDSNASGGSRVDGLNGVGAYVEFTLNTDCAAEAELVFHYAASPAATPKFTLSVNGTDVEKLSFPLTGGWALDKPADLKTTVQLKAGANVIRIYKADANDTPLHGINLDYLDVTYETAGTVEKIYTVSFLQPPVSFDFTRTTKEELLQEWTIVNEDATHWTIDENGLTITTKRGDLWQATNTGDNLFMQDAAGDWIMEAKVEFPTKPNAEYQQAGILAYQDIDNYIKLGLQGSSNSCRVQLSQEKGAKGTEVGVKTVDADAVWYRLTKTGDVYMGYYSLDGENWTYLGTITMPMNNIKITLIALNGDRNVAEIPMVFRYMHFTQTYTVSFNTNEGGAIEAQQVAKDTPVTKPADPEKDDFAFGGWYADAACTNAYDFETGVQYPMTLHAKWLDNAPFAENVDLLIAAIDLEDKATIDAARAAYDSLTDAQKALVTKLAELEAAELYWNTVHNAVSLVLTGPDKSTGREKTVTYALSGKGMNNLATMLLSFTISDEYLTNPVVEAAEGWMIVAQSWKDGVLNVAICNNTGATGDGDILTIALELQEATGNASVAITFADLAAYLGDGETFVKADLDNASVTTYVKYNIFDVNNDGIVDQRDITRAQRYYGTDNTDADVNGDGTVSIDDMVLILNNFTDLFL